MAATTEKKETLKDKVVVDKNMRDYSKEAVFVKKHEQAWEFIQKHGLPDGLDEKITSTK
jgi:hypothetical protein